MPDDRVLRTKLNAPEPHPLAVDRVEALDALDHGLAIAGAVVLVSLPGHGRLDLLARWARDRATTPTIWLRLDQWDDIARLLRHLVAALQELDPAIGAEAVRSAGDGAEAIRDVALPRLAADIDAYGRDFTIVIDGVHRVLDPVTQVGIRSINRYHPTNMRVAFVADDDAVSEFRGIGGVGRIPRLEDDDLRFTDDHVARMLEHVGVAARPSDVARVLDSTAGWPLAVLRAIEQSGHSGRATAYDPTSPDHADELHRVLCRPLSPDLHAVASDLAVAGSTTPRRLEELSERPGAVGALQVLRQRHLVTSDGHRMSLMPVVRAHLLHERTVQDPTTAAVLRRRSARLLADAGEPGTALELLLEADDHEAASRLLLERHRQWSAIRLDVVPRAVEQALIHDPALVELHLVRAWFALFSEDDDTARAIIDGLAVLPLEPARRLRAQSEIEMLDAVLARRAGRMDDGLFHAIACEELASRLDRDDPALVEIPYTAVAPGVLSLYLGHALFHAGELEDARAELQRANVSRQWSRPALAAMHGALGIIGWLEADISASTHAAIAAANLDGELTSSNHLAAAAFALVGSGDDAEAMVLRYAESVERIAEPTSAVLGHVIGALRAPSTAEARRAHAAARAAVERCTQPGVLSLLVARAASLLDLPDGAPELGEQLTDGELRVVRALRGDLTEREIAAELHLSHNTVRAYRRRAYRKLGVISRADAIAALDRRRDG